MKKLNRAVLVTLKFAVAGIVWILFSDYLINTFVTANSSFDVEHLQILKGILFVGACGAFIFTLLHDANNHASRHVTGHEVLFLSNPMAMSLVRSESFRFMDLNQAARKFFGYKLDEASLMTLRDLVIPEEKERFSEVYLFLRTGFDKLGTWNFKCANGEVRTAELYALSVPARQAYLIAFRDVTEERRLTSELSLTKKHLQHQIARRTDYLERANEELAYRASQTEHVNAELIVVNEQLLRINKRIAGELEQLTGYKRDLGQIFSALKEAVWSYNLSDGGKSFFGSDLSALFECADDELNHAWFWLNFIHPDDQHMKEAHQRAVFEKGETFCSFRIITKRGNERALFIHVRIARNQSGTTFLVGSFSDVSGYPAEEVSRFLNTRIA